MAMTAIRLHKNNLMAIRKVDSTMSRSELLSMIVGCGCQNQSPLYFIPKFESEHMVFDGPAFMPQPTFSLTFDADMTKIETEFVKISRK